MTRLAWLATMVSATAPPNPICLGPRTPLLAQYVCQQPVMIGGIAILGAVTATLASWFVETMAAEKEQAEGLQVTVRRLEQDRPTRCREEEWRGPS